MLNNFLILTYFVLGNSRLSISTSDDEDTKTGDEEKTVESFSPDKRVSFGSSPSKPSTPSKRDSVDMEKNKQGYRDKSILKPVSTSEIVFLIQCVYESNQQLKQCSFKYFLKVAAKL